MGVLVIVIGERHVTGALRYTLLLVLQSAWLGQVWQAARWGEARRIGYFADYEREFRETEGGAARWTGLALFQQALFQQTVFQPLHFLWIGFQFVCPPLGSLQQGHSVVPSLTAVGGWVVQG